MAVIGEHAIVTGASLGGLLVAHVLAEHYRHVTLFDRDVLPAGFESRKAVPQGRHVHGLLARGREALEALLPGLTARLVEHGALLGDALADAHRYIGKGFYCRSHSNMLSLLVSRPLLEAVVRTQVLARGNVRVVERREVVGLLATSDGRRIHGVQVREHGREVQEVRGDLVVDASGRGSKIGRWLAALGVRAPEEELLRVGMCYASRGYRRDPAQLSGAKIVQVIPTTGIQRGAVLVAQEGDRWLLTMAGYLGDEPPLDEHGFLEFARSLPVPDIHRVAATAEPLGEATSARFPASLRRRFERLADLPERLLVVADSLCSFNPIYGQGMTVAALEALVLRDCLAHGEPERLASRFFARAGKLLDIPWKLALDNDRRFVDPNHRRGPLARCVSWYLDKLHDAAQRDPVAAMAFLKVVNLMATPPSVLHPKIAMRVLWHHLIPREVPAS